MSKSIKIIVSEMNKVLNSRNGTQYELKVDNELDYIYFNEQVSSNTTSRVARLGIIGIRKGSSILEINPIADELYADIKKLIVTHMSLFKDVEVITNVLQDPLNASKINTKSFKDMIIKLRYLPDITLEPLVSKLISVDFNIVTRAFEEAQCFTPRFKKSFIKSLGNDGEVVHKEKDKKLILRPIKELTYEVTIPLVHVYSETIGFESNVKQLNNLRLLHIVLSYIKENGMDEDVRVLFTNLISHIEDGKEYIVRYTTSIGEGQIAKVFTELYEDTTSNFKDYNDVPIKLHTVFTDDGYSYMFSFTNKNGINKEGTYSSSNGMYQELLSRFINERENIHMQLATENMSIPSKDITLPYFNDLTVKMKDKDGKWWLS